MRVRILLERAVGRTRADQVDALVVNEREVSRVSFSGSRGCASHLARSRRIRRARLTALRRATADPCFIKRWAETFHQSVADLPARNRVELRASAPPIYVSRTLSAPHYRPGSWSTATGIRTPVSGPRIRSCGNRTSDTARIGVLFTLLAQHDVIHHVGRSDDIPDYPLTNGGTLSANRFTSFRQRTRQQQRHLLEWQRAQPTLQRACFLLPKVLPKTRFMALSRTRLAPPEPYRYGDLNPGFRTENPAS